MREYHIDTSRIAQSQRAAAFEKLVVPMGRPTLDKSSPPITSRARVTQLPGGSLVSKIWHSPATYHRSLPMGTQMPDDVMAHICLGGEYTINQGTGTDVRGTPGWIYLDPMQSPGTVHYHAPGVHIMYISTPWPKLLELAPATTPMLRKRFPFSPQWSDVLHHARSLHRLADQGMPVDSAAFETKLRHLFAAACNASAEQMGLGPQGAGLEARRRLTAIKTKIEDHLIDPLLSAERIATLSGISARYLRSLFAKDKVSFTDYVNARRLARVHALIVDPERRTVPISKLALECGFNDASWFTSQFRRAFGIAPSDARAQAIVQWQATQPATV